MRLHDYASSRLPRTSLSDPDRPYSHAASRASVQGVFNRVTWCMPGLRDPGFELVLGSRAGAPRAALRREVPLGLFFGAVAVWAARQGRSLALSNGSDLALLV